MTWRLIVLVMVLGVAAAIVCIAQGIGHNAMLGDTALGLTGAWAGVLWLAARREARRLAGQPRPTACPRRRCLYGRDDAPGAHLDPTRALFGQFRLRSGRVPARRTLDMIRCLQWFARRCGAACVVLTAAALTMLLVVR
jgi:hypothetical protein